MTAFVTAGAGFLLAVLWFDLMFDVQMRGRARNREQALGSIASYYGRVTLRARPMNRLVGVVMLATLAALVVQVLDSDDPRWAALASLVLTTAAVGLAAGRTFGAARRLGTQRDPLPKQEQLARSILRDHVMCLAAIVTVLALQLAFAG